MEREQTLPGVCWALQKSAKDSHCSQMILVLTTGHLGSQIDFDDKIWTSCALARISCLDSKTAEIKITSVSDALLRGSNTKRSVGLSAEESSCLGEVSLVPSDHLDPLTDV